MPFDDLALDPRLPRNSLPMRALLPRNSLPRIARLPRNSEPMTRRLRALLFHLSLFTRLPERRRAPSPRLFRLVLDAGASGDSSSMMMDWSLAGSVDWSQLRMHWHSQFSSTSSEKIQSEQRFSIVSTARLPKNSEPSRRTGRTGNDDPFFVTE